jgi:hypothetical protein
VVRVILFQKYPLSALIKRLRVGIAAPHQRGCRLTALENRVVDLVRGPSRSLALAGTPVDDRTGRGGGGDQAGSAERKAQSSAPVVPAEAVPGLSATEPPRGG